MDQQSRDVTTFLLGTFLTLCIISGLLTRYVLMPYLRDHLMVKVDETHKQVTENHHTNDQPTVLDRIDDVGTDMKALTRVMDEHLRWSDRWTDVYERRLDMLAAQLNGEAIDDDETTDPTT